MTPRKTHQLGGRKEAPLAIVGSDDSDIVQQPSHSQFFTPEDAAYDYYQELFKGFFEKFTRWKEILAAEEYEEGKEERRGFSVFRSNSGLSIQAGTTRVRDDPPDKILEVRNHTYLNKTEPIIALGEQFLIRPGQAGRHLLVDPEDGRSLEEVEIRVSMQSSPFEDEPLMRLINIKTERLSEEKRRDFRYLKYCSQGKTLKVYTSHNQSAEPTMNEQHP